MDFTTVTKRRETLRTTIALLSLTHSGFYSRGEYRGPDPTEVVFIERPAEYMPGQDGGEVVAPPDHMMRDEWADLYRYDLRNKQGREAWKANAREGTRRVTMEDGPAWFRACAAKGSLADFGVIDLPPEGRALLMAWPDQTGHPGNGPVYKCS